jgi:hypothetical protein
MQYRSESYWTVCAVRLELLAALEDAVCRYRSQAGSLSSVMATRNGMAFERATAACKSTAEAVDTARLAYYTHCKEHGCTEETATPAHHAAGLPARQSPLDHER